MLAFMGIKSGSKKVFEWFANMTAVAGLMTWFGIGFTYLRFHAGLIAQGIDRDALPFKSPLQPFLAYYIMASTLIICFFSGFSVFLKDSWDTPTFVTNYLPFILFPIMYAIGRFFVYRTPLVRAQDMDFVSGIAEIEADSYDEDEPKNFVERFWKALM